MQVPFGTSVSARSLAGDLKVTKVKGEVQLESANGTVEAIGTPKLSRVKTLSGDILIADSGSVEGLSASTVSGRLVVKGVKTRALELATISGDLVLVNIACDRAQVRTVSGTMEFAGPLVKSGRYEFTSHAGDVRLKLAGSQGFELAAKTFSGDVHSDLPLTMVSSGTLPPGGPERRDVRGHVRRRQRAGDREDLQRIGRGEPRRCREGRQGETGQEVASRSPSGRTARDAGARRAGC